MILWMKCRCIVIMLVVFVDVWSFCMVVDNVIIVIIVKSFNIINLLVFLRERERMREKERERDVLFWMLGYLREYFFLCFSN